MVQVCGALLIGGALAIVPLGMGGIPLLKLLFFALAALMGATGLCRTGLHGAPTDTVRICRASECSPVLHCITLLTFFAVVFLSPLWSTAPFLSVVGVEPRFEGVMAYGVFLGLTLMAGGMVRSGREQFLLHAVLWSNIGVVAYGLLQLLGMDPFRGFWDAEAFLGRVFSGVGQPNMLGQFLVLTAPIAILTTWRRWGTNSLSLLVLNFIVLLSTGSRAAMVGAIVAGGLYFLSLGERIQERGSKESFYPLSPLPTGRHRSFGRVTLPLRGRGFCLSLCILFLVLLLAFLPLAFQRFSLSGEWDRSISGRIAIWRDAVSMIRARPIGWGLETTGLVFPRFQRAPLTAYESLTTSVDRAHSKPLDLLLTVGPLGFLSYYTFLLFLFLRSFQVWRSRRDPLVLAGMAGLAGVSASLLFGFEGVVTHAFFWLVCGMLLGRVLSPLGREIERGGQKIPFSLNAVASLLPPVLFVVLFLLALSLSARLTMERAERAFRRGNLAVAVQLYDSAVRRTPWDRALLIRFIETVLLARERAADIPTQEKFDIVLMKRLHHLDRLTSGSDPLLPSLRAWRAALRGEGKEALAFLDDAGPRAPFSISHLRIAGKVAELLGNMAMGEAMRAELIRMLPPWWNDASNPRHRILWKENPWLEELLIPPPPAIISP